MDPSLPHVGTSRFVDDEGAHSAQLEQRRRAGTGHVVAHPEVYPFAAHVAARIGASHVVELGCGRGRQLAKMGPELVLIGLDRQDVIAGLRAEYGFGHWLGWEPEGDGTLPPALVDPLAGRRQVLSTSVVICAGALDRVQSSASVLSALRRLMEFAPAGVVTTRRHEAAGLRRLLEDAGLRVDFVGLTLSDDRHSQRDTAMAILANNHSPALASAPSDYRVLAIMAVYNEQDVILPSLHALINQGIDVYLVDNWSTDATVDLARTLLGAGVVAIERFPDDGPPDSFQPAAILNRKEEIATEVEADWYLHIDADEIRRSPWPGVSLRDALCHVDRLGYNAVDHNLMQFHPVDDGYVAGTNFEDYFPHFLFDDLSDFQVKTWKNVGQRVTLAAGGHVALFSGRRVYPYNFVYKHYAVRSQSHGERKYASVPMGQNFLRDPASLLRFEDPITYETHMVEILAAIGDEARRDWNQRPIVR